MRHPTFVIAVELVDLPGRLELADSRVSDASDLLLEGKEQVALSRWWQCASAAL